MEKFYIEYNGKSYPYVELAYNKIYDDEISSHMVKIADVSLWDAIEDDYNNGKREAEEIDGEIFFYCDYGFIDNCNEGELLEYLWENGC